jgi:hypothetical protein
MPPGRSPWRCGKGFSGDDRPHGLHVGSRRLGSRRPGERRAAYQSLNVAARVDPRRSAIPPLSHGRPPGRCVAYRQMWMVAPGVTRRHGRVMLSPLSRKTVRGTNTGT